MYKLDTLLLKQKMLSVLDIAGFFPHSYPGEGVVLIRKKKPTLSNTGRFFSFNTTVSYAYSIPAIGEGPNI